MKKEIIELLDQINDVRLLHMIRSFLSRLIELNAAK